LGPGHVILIVGIRIFIAVVVIDMLFDGPPMGPVMTPAAMARAVVISSIVSPPMGFPVVMAVVLVVFVIIVAAAVMRAVVSARPGTARENEDKPNQYQADKRGFPFHVIPPLHGGVKSLASCLGRMTIRQLKKLTRRLNDRVRGWE